MSANRGDYMRFQGGDYGKYRDELQDKVHDVLTRNAIKYIIGISGDADVTQQLRTEGLVEAFIETIKQHPCAVLTGGTKGGVPQIGVEIAKRHGIPRIGVFPQQGHKYALWNELDIAIETTPPDMGEGTFGTETPTFVNLLDAATIIGGSYGTLTEVTTILKTNVKRLADAKRYPESVVRPPIYIAPISGTGGAADHAHEIARVFGRGADTTLPQQPIASGAEAAAFILEKLN
ncbi:MAG: hypothetical protein ACM3KF_03315 [Acidobacteriota bacterium]